jgi:SAM-dependent methyltransferase
VSADIIARPSRLPVLGDCVDAVLLPHTLEFAADPYAVLREVDRVLTGEGQLLVLGFRPWSLWGMRARWSRSGFPPGMRRLLSERLLREWLVLLGFEVTVARRYLYLGPWSRGLARGEGTGRMLRAGLTYPLPAGAYLLRARKRLYTLTPVRPRLREKTAVIGALVKPTTRNQA